METYLIIKEIAQRKKIEQKELASAFNVSENQMSNYLTGRTKILADHIPVYAKLLRVPVERLFSNEIDLKILEEPVSEYELNDCKLCKSKDKTIEAQQEIIDLLKNQIENLTKK